MQGICDTVIIIVIVSIAHAHPARHHHMVVVCYAAVVFDFELATAILNTIG